ncbi:MAG TPA: DUF2141 domain-containing protein [Bacillota bacterium]|nr:DUF2141 domain-containing protein [Bacillota bacterium]
MSKVIRFMVVVLVLSGLIFASVALADDGGKITVKLSGLRNDSGTAYVVLFKSGEGFPMPSEKNTFAILSAPITPSLEGEAVFENVPYGEYAISVIHDENNDQQLNFNDQGVPLEGVGLSNNGDAADYEKAKFKLDSEELDVSIQMQYFQ